MKITKRVDALEMNTPVRIAPGNSERERTCRVIQSMVAVAHGDNSIDVPLAMVPFGLTHDEWCDLAIVDRLSDEQINTHCARLEMDKSQRQFFDNAYDAELPLVQQLEQLRPKPATLEIYARHMGQTIDAANRPADEQIQMWAMWFEVNAFYFDLVEDARAENLRGDDAKMKAQEIYDSTRKHSYDVIEHYDLTEDEMTQFFKQNQLGALAL